MICAGTLSLLRKAGWEVHIATMAPGDKGTAEYSQGRDKQRSEEKKLQMLQR